MSDSIKKLRELIRKETQALLETKLRRTREGNKVEFASEKYIEEVEKDLEELMSIRDRRGMRERERYVLSQAVRHLRTSLKRARRSRDKLEKIKSAQPEKEKVIISEE
jgi:hypothetical protein|tara:strand:- start:217 stop:540 length:324 start_codon:yes stop_codon:yes gene_type:complete